MGNFRELIVKSFDFLFESGGFNIIEEVVDDDLRNFIVIVQGRALRLRFVKDRADIFLDVGCVKESETWHEFYKIISWLEANNYIIKGYKASNNLANTRKYLKENLIILEKLFDVDNYQETKEALVNNRNVSFL